MRFNIVAITQSGSIINALIILNHLLLNDYALNLLSIEFQQPNAAGKSRHGQPTRIRYGIPSTVRRRLRLL